jgi:pimeloyl-ACP methyl ester carboxylesterase
VVPVPAFTSFDGARLEFLSWPGSAELPPVVLLHGFIANAALNWVGPGIVDALTAAGRQVFAPDARGHGESEKLHDPDRYGEATMVRDVVALLDLIDAPAVDLVGYSMGAVVAALTAAFDKRIRRLVLGGVGAGMVEVGGLDTRVIPPDDVSAALLSDEPVDLTSPAGTFRAFADFAGSDRHALAAAIAGSRPSTIPLGDITAPTLVIAGESDLLAARPEVLASAIPGATLRTFAGDHLTVLRHPALIPTIATFLTTPTP